MPIAVILRMAGLKAIFVPGAGWHTGNAPGAAFLLPLRPHPIPARNAVEFAHLSMLPAIHLIAGVPVALIRVYDKEYAFMYRYLFGPVPSRRLGISLGIDLVPMKTCTLDCIYCECGRTTDLTIARGEYVPLESVKAEYRHYRDHHPAPDYITFSGSGEQIGRAHV